MDHPSLELTLKIIGAGVTLLGTSKALSDLGVNRVSRKKQVAELIKDLTDYVNNRSTPHSMEIQAKFQAAFGGSPRQIPKKKEILDFLRNEELATLSNAMEFADCMEFVAYSNQRKVFVARPPWTPCKLRLERWGEIFLYSVSAAICIGLIAAPAFDPNRLWLIFPTAFYAVLKATLGAQVRRAQKLLRKKVTRGTSPGVPPEQVPPTGSPNSR